GFLSKGESHTEYQGGRPEPEQLGGAALLHVVQLVARLGIIAGLPGDVKIRVAWNQSIHEVSSDRAFVMVFEDEFVVGAAARQIGFELDPDASAPLLQLPQAREFRRNQLRR